MNVRIVEDYWENYKNHEELIKRCFHYLFLTKYPNTEGAQNSYQELVVEFSRLNVFSRFQASKHPDHLVSKKFEAFIYNWVRKVLSDIYSKNYKDSLRYKHTPYIDYVVPGSTLCEQYRKSTEKNWQQESMEHIAHKKSSVKKKRRKKKHFPNHNDASDYIGKLTEDPDHYTERRELLESIRDIAESSSEQKVIDMYLEGYDRKQIADQLGCESYQIKTMMAKLRKRCLQNLKIRAAVA